MPRFGVKTDFVNPNDPEAIEKAIKPNTKLVFGEVIGNDSYQSYQNTELLGIRAEFTENRTGKFRTKPSQTFFQEKLKFPNFYKKKNDFWGHIVKSHLTVLACT